MTDVRIKKLAQRRCTESDFFFLFFFLPLNLNEDYHGNYIHMVIKRNTLSDELLLQKSSKAVI